MPLLFFFVFNFLSQQSMTLVLFLTISNIDFLTFCTLRTVKEKTEELCTETSEMTDA